MQQTRRQAELALAELDSRSCLLTVAGELNSSLAFELGDLVLSPTASRMELVVVDISGAEFIESVGLAILIASQYETERRGGRFVLVCDRPELLSAFRRAGVDRKLRIVTSHDGLLPFEPANRSNGNGASANGNGASANGNGPEPPRV